MSDIKLAYKDIGGAITFQGFDVRQLGADLEGDDSLYTAVVISLFTDRRANDDDELPAIDDLRGWWADAWPEIEGDLIGSRLWLLAREKQLPSVVARAREYAEEALRWLIEDGVAEKVTVTAEIVRQGVLGLGIEIFKPRIPPLKFQFNYLWEAVRAV